MTTYPPVLIGLCRHSPNRSPADLEAGLAPLEAAALIESQGPRIARPCQQHDLTAPRLPGSRDRRLQNGLTVAPPPVPGIGDDILDQGIRRPALRQVRDHRQGTARYQNLTEEADENAASLIAKKLGQDALGTLDRKRQPVGMELIVQGQERRQIGRRCSSDVDIRRS